MAVLSHFEENLDKTAGKEESQGALLRWESIFYGFAAMAIAATALFLRIHALGAKSIWVDEASSIEIARLGWRDFLLIIWNREANMAAYLLLLRFWMLFGDKEPFVRALSVAFSLATVGIIYLLGKRLFGRTAGLLASWLLAINAYHVRYAQETRAYAMVVFLIFLATLLLVRNLQEPEKGQWTAYTVVCILAVYTHLFAGFFVLGHAAALTVLRRASVDWPAIRRSFFLLTLGVVPLGAYFLSRGTESMNWLPPMNLRTILWFFTSISGNGGVWLLVLECVALAALVYGGWSVWRAKGFGTDDWGYVLIPAMFVIPVAVTCGISFFKPFFLARYLNPTVPAWTLCVGAGLVRIRPVVVRALLAAAISAFCFLGVASYYKTDLDVQRGDWRSASEFVLDHTKPGDDVFYLNFFGMPLEYYRSQSNPPSNWPRAVTTQDGRLHYQDFLRLPIADRLRDARPAGRRVWLLLDTTGDTDSNPGNEIVRGYFKKGRQLVEARKFDFISVELYEKD